MYSSKTSTTEMAKFRLSCCLNLLTFIRCFGVMIMPVESSLHIVGKNFAWRVPGNDSFYQEWAASRNFTVGDELVFMYTSRTHSVLEVSKKDFENCTKDQIIRKDFRGPSTFVELNRPGNHYYICDFRRDCLHGMKLTVTVMKAEAIYLSSSPNGDAHTYHSPTWIGRLGTVYACLVFAVMHALVA